LGNTKRGPGRKKVTSWKRKRKKIVISSGKNRGRKGRDFHPLDKGGEKKRIPKKKRR